MEKFFERIFITKHKQIKNELTLDERLQTLCAISALVSMGNHDFLYSYLKYSLERTLNIEEIQEVILQCYLFAGFPATIEGFIVLKTLQDESYQPLPPKEIHSDITLWKKKGKALSKQIYQENYEKVFQNMKNLNPDLSEWILIEGYGKTLSRDGLKPITREYCAIASLAVLNWKRQLFSHCKGALNLGASIDDIQSVLLFMELFKPGTQKRFSSIVKKL